MYQKAGLQKFKCFHLNKELFQRVNMCIISCFVDQRGTVKALCN